MTLNPSWFPVLNGDGRLPEKYLPSSLLWRPALDSHTVVTLGDSIENSNSYYTSVARTNGPDWPTYAHVLSGGRFRLIYNAGIGGQRTDQYLARFATDVTAYDPSMVVIGAGENDAEYAVTPAVYADNIEALVAAVRGIGAVPVLRTTLPNTDSPDNASRILAYNAWTRDYAARQRIPLLDFWAQTVDPVTNLFLPGVSPDGIHPNEEWSRHLARHAVDVLWPGVSAMTLPLPDDVLAAENLVPNPGFATDTDGSPDGWWAINGTPTGAARTMVTDNLVQGRMARFRNDSASAFSLFCPPITSAAEGDVLELSGVLSSDGGVYAAVALAVEGGSGTLNHVPVSGLTAPLLRATYRIRAVAPAGFVGAQVQLTVGPGTGYVDHGCPIVRNLTAEGLA